MMKVYRRLQAGIVLALVLYVVIGHGASWRGYEIYPIYDWDLFSLVPQNRVGNFGLRVVNVDGLVVEPRYFENTVEIFPEAKSGGANILIQQLGRAVQADDGVQVAQIRAEFEAAYMRGVESAEYEIIFRIFDPVERIRSGVYIDQKPLATYQWGQGLP